MKHKVMIARFPGSKVEHPDSTDWYVRTVLECKADQRIDDPLFLWKISDTPITMCRNRAAKVALDNDCDFLLMLDNDMTPDLYDNPADRAAMPNVKPFWKHAFEFMLNSRTPCLVAAPYCGPYPEQQVYVARWEEQDNGSPHSKPKTTRLSHHEADLLSGFQEGFLLATGVMLIDTNVFKHMPPPWFDYEWTDAYQTHKATTEDYYFSRNARMCGIETWCFWDAWAGHNKMHCIGKPTPVRANAVRKTMRAAIARGVETGNVVMDIRPDGRHLPTNGVAKKLVKR